MKPSSTRKRPTTLGHPSFGGAMDAITTNGIVAAILLSPIPTNGIHSIQGQSQNLSLRNPVQAQSHPPLQPSSRADVRVTWQADKKWQDANAPKQKIWNVAVLKRPNAFA